MAGLVEILSFCRQQKLTYDIQITDRPGHATNLARKAQVNPSTLTGFLSEKPRVKQLRPATLRAISDSTGVPLPPELATPIKMSAAMRQVSNGMPRDVPLHSLIAAPVVSAYYWNRTVADYAPRPTGIAHSSKVFAVRMPDETMDGWRRVNELIFIDPVRAVAEGDHAFIELANANDPNGPGVHMIRRVIRRRPAGVVLATWGLEPSEVSIPRTTVLTFFRILEWSEVIGI